MSIRPLDMDRRNFLIFVIFLAPIKDTRQKGDYTWTKASDFKHLPIMIHSILFEYAKFFLSVAKDLAICLTDTYLSFMVKLLLGPEMVLGLFYVLNKSRYSHFSSLQCRFEFRVPIWYVLFFSLSISLRI